MLYSMYVCVCVLMCVSLNIKYNLLTKKTSKNKPLIIYHDDDKNMIKMTTLLLLIFCMV